MSPLTPWGLLRQRTSDDGPTPLVTMYDDTTGERVELSAVSFGNWVAKTANLLVDEFDIEPGDVVTLELPAHWQSFVVGFAVFAAGASTGPGGRVRAVTEPPAPGGAAPDEDTLVLSLRPMGGGRTTLGTGIDYATEVRLHGDYFAGGDGASLDLEVPIYPPGSRLLTVEPAHDAAFVTMLAALRCGGSLVLVRNEDPATRERRVAAERVTVTV